jgi:DNA-binding FrmR family transcriptional regulator
MFFKNNNTKIVGKHFTLSEGDKQKLATNINKVIGQLESIKQDILTDNSCDQSLVQILAVKGGVASVGKELIGKGVLNCLQDYTQDELELIIKNLLKLD